MSQPCRQVAENLGGLGCVRHRLRRERLGSRRFRDVRSHCRQSNERHRALRRCHVAQGGAPTAGEAFQQRREGRRPSRGRGPGTGSRRAAGGWAPGLNRDPSACRCSARPARRRSASRPRRPPRRDCGRAPRGRPHRQDSDRSAVQRGLLARTNSDRAKSSPDTYVEIVPCRCLAARDTQHGVGRYRGTDARGRGGHP
jgi:hypothetical protein